MAVTSNAGIAAVSDIEPQRTTAQWITGFDYLRVAAIFAVVWIHGSDTNALAKWLQTYTYFAVPCFLMISAYLIERRYNVQAESGASFVTDRLYRLVPAYLVWSAVYLALRSLKRYWITGNIDFAYDWVLVVFCGGASYQLWFIPALIIYFLVFSVLTKPLLARWQSQPAPVMWFVCGAGMLVAGMVAAKGVAVDPQYELFVRSTVAYAGYYVIGISVFLAGTRYKWYRGGKLLIPAVIGAFMVSIFHKAYSTLFLLMAVFSVSVFILAERFRVHQSNDLIRTLSAYTMGIYLAHAMFVEGLQMLLPSIGYDLANFLPTLFVIVLAYLLSAVLCMILYKWQKTRWMVA